MSDSRAEAGARAVRTEARPEEKQPLSRAVERPQAPFTTGQSQLESAWLSLLPTSLASQLCRVFLQLEQTNCSKSICLDQELPPSICRKAVFRQ